ncbi:hypothetical protein M4D51_01970 [Microbacterium sp. p3-SID338]|uniref:hypothetical protein n=1 Tax=unclassified Microbacterium TaxID=2609290 RepID=UPI000C8058FC|nr:MULTISPECIES: hypothetical protein [unclassified Microbacterium]MCT1394488.1 hypothetical protein [Microbacterium sp. p3-SID338]PMC03411.1 hypothetical protein CJ226_11395 [Microbacterium sp. UMB0228]
MTSPRRVPAGLRKRGGFRGADDSTASLILGQFFVGGFFLFMVAFFLALGVAEEYDGVTSFVGASIIAVVLSVVSMITALVIGLPLRLVSALRARWLAHGEVTVLGVVVGLGACIVSVVLAGGSGGAALPWWAFVVSWTVLAFSVAHFVWPGRRPQDDPREPHHNDQAA